MQWETFQKKNLRMCCNQSQWLCGFLKELRRVRDRHRRRPSYLLRVKCHVWRSKLRLHFDPVYLCVFPKGHGAKCAQSKWISSYRHQRALLLPSFCPSVSPALIYTSAAVVLFNITHKTSFIEFHIYLFVVDLQAFLGQSPSSMSILL